MPKSHRARRSRGYNQLVAEFERAYEPSWRGTESASTTVTGQYRSHGQNRPSKPNLARYKRVLQDQKRSRYGVLLADICIDLAVEEPGAAMGHLEDAFEALMMTRITKPGSNNSIGQILPTKALASLRAAELNTWSEAIAKRPLGSNYLALLRAASAADEHSRYVQQVESIVIESVPVLLGARALHRGHSNGWHGRMALTREDKGLNHSHLNWDCAVGDGADFIDPTRRLQIKKGAVKLLSQDFDNGIMHVSARQHGFDDTTRLINGCLLEAGMYDKPDIVGQYFSGDQLDDITGRLGQSITNFYEQ